MSHIETVKIVNEANKRTGFKIINTSDFDEKTMTLFEAEQALNPDKMKVADLKAELDAREIEYTEDDKKADLAELLQAALDA